jgi:hypothetical protein
VPWRRNVSVAASVLGLGLAVAATAFAAAGDEAPAQDRQGESPEMRVIERGSERFDRAVADHRTEVLSDRYRDLYAEAEKLEVAPARNLAAAASEEPSVAELEEGVGGLRDRVAEAREASDASPAESGDFGLVGGVSQATLDSIAACESGGDPTAVNGAGYYGKYQFDLGTWQSVGGSGNPAEASEAEQDMRASMLYARAGSSPWPVCGA